MEPTADSFPSLRVHSRLALACHVCASTELVEIPHEAIRGWVSSDSKPVKRGEPLVVCANCGCLQKQQTERWHAQSSEIYAKYSIYGNSAGSEQLVFESGLGLAQTRSSRILQHLLANFSIHSKGRMLDVGCGNGATLRAFSCMRPDWTLFGTELSDKYKEQVESISGVEAMVSTGLGDVPGEFDLVSLVHVLEHIPDPVAYLTGLRLRLKPDGLLLIEVPDHASNPFDLIIADHSTHFSLDLLSRVVRAAGYEVVRVVRDWIPKELSLVARRAANFPDHPLSPLSGTSVVTAKEVAEERMRWLATLVNAAAAAAAASPRFGLLGTTIGATWLYAELGGNVAFFLDENVDCAGARHLGKPVYMPPELPAGSTVYVGIPSPASALAAERLAKAHPEVDFVASPPL
jgi:SAM-dependent methyltransferase